MESGGVRDARSKRCRHDGRATGAQAKRLPHRVEWDGLKPHGLAASRTGSRPPGPGATGLRRGRRADGWHKGWSGPNTSTSRAATKARTAGSCAAHEARGGPDSARKAVRLGERSLSAGSSARSPRATSGREAGESGRAADGESRRQGGPVQKRRSQQQPGGQGIFDEQVGLLTEQTGLREYAADLAVFVVMEGLVMVVAVTREPFVMVRIGGRGPMVTMVERAGGGATVAGIRGDARERSVMMIEAAGPVQRSAKRRLEEEEKQQNKSGGAHR
jgi:hypothetical protein